MKKSSVFILILACAFAYSQSEKDDGWTLFSKVKFSPKFFKQLNETFLVPAFDEKIKLRVGTEVKVKGHFMPFDLPKNQLIVSRYPYSSCFFCGGAGPESVAEVILKDNAPN